MKHARYAGKPVALLIATLLLARIGAADAAMTDPVVRARDAFVQLQAGKVDRSALTPALNADLTDAVLATMSAGVAPLGPPGKFAVSSKSDVDGVTTYVFRLTAKTGSVDYVFGIDDVSGKIAKLFFRPGPPV